MLQTSLCLNTERRAPLQEGSRSRWQQVAAGGQGEFLNWALKELVSALSGT